MAVNAYRNRDGLVAVAILLDLLLPFDGIGRANSLARAVVVEAPPCLRVQLLLEDFADQPEPLLAQRALLPPIRHRALRGGGAARRGEPAIAPRARRRTRRGLGPMLKPKASNNSRTLSLPAHRVSP